MKILLNSDTSRAYYYLCTLLILLLFSTSCSVPISYYDGTTYRQLTELKAESVLLFESFDTKAADKNCEKIEKVTLKLLKAYEYEYGKGEPNSDTSKQFIKIINSFKSEIAEYNKYGPASEELGKAYFTQQSITLGQAFDIAIKTENLKNKDKR